MSDLIKQLGEQITDEVRRQLLPQISAEISGILRGNVQLAYTEEEAAGQLRMSPATLKKKRLKGEINYHRDGRLITYTLADLADYLERIHHQPLPPKFEIVPKISLLGPKVQQIRKVG